MTTPALVLLDRDGVLLQHVFPYILSLEHAEPVPGAWLAASRLSQAGVAIAIVTNQSPVGRQLISMDDARRISDWVVSGIEALGGHVSGVWHCPHTASDGCPCRKPRPGMLVEAMQAVGVPPALTWMVGDHETDIQAGIAAGCARTVHVTGGRQRTASMRASSVYLDLAGMVDDLLGGDDR
jgi:D-glycero-D-manno-heptose 1,7-bisphosphate phosphatase